MSDQIRSMERGVSILEALVVVALIGVIALLAIPNFADTLNNYRVGTAASEVAVNLRYARNASIKHKKNYTFELSIEADPALRDSYTVKGGSKDLVYYLNEKVQFKSGSSDHFTFSPNGAASVDPAGTFITLVDPRGMDHYEIRVNGVGYVDVKDLTK